MKPFVVGLLPAFVVAVLLSLGGCAELNAARAGVAKHGAQAMDQALDDAKWVTCSAASIGSLERELGGDKERILGWMLYCGKKPTISPMLPIPEQTPPAAVTPQGWRPLDASGVARGPI